MSSNPLMMGYEGGERSGRCPSLCVQAVCTGQWPG